MITLGYDIGSSSIKAALLRVDTGEALATAYSPRTEMPILAERAGWAEQDPRLWWTHVVAATREVMRESGIDPSAIRAIGISYQMHGLIVLDASLQPLRPAIIWCDSRAVSTGESAFASLGAQRCLSALLNSPGNFTASKLAWVREHEPGLFSKIARFMLPGDYVALRMTGEPATTVSGLSEGTLWDFSAHQPARFLLEYYGIDPSVMSPLTPTFGIQGTLRPAAAEELGLAPGTPVAYRAGDQPNNALSLHVLQPGEIAATAGTSGVVYGVSDRYMFDPQSRVNSFAHVNHATDAPRIGILLCINGTGISNSWIRKVTGAGSQSYDSMNALAQSVPVGSEGVVVLPFGNGAERMLGNREVGAQTLGLNFNIHSPAHLYRAVQEGVAFSFRYGMDIMRTLGVHPSVIRAGSANLFLSPVFCEALASVSGVTIELYNTDGAVGAARGAAIGSGLVGSTDDAFKGLKRVGAIEPVTRFRAAYDDAYARWSALLAHALER
ncbi:MAG: carbohydrate kinase [Bacteroidetes bacterium]|nr:carbohydrate kinase [Bacteroidota bacterium]